MDDALLPSETSGAGRALRNFGYFVLVALTLTTAVLGVVKGMDAGRHGLIFVAIVLLPLLFTSVLLLRWTDGESIDERLNRVALASAISLVVMDIALIVVMVEPQRQDEHIYT